MKFSGERLRMLQEGLDGVARKIQGDWIGHVYGVKRQTPFASTAAALAAMVANRLDGYAMDEVGNPDRLVRLVHTPGASSGIRHDPASVQVADELHEVRRAFEDAYRELPETGGVLDRRGCELVLLLRYVAGKTPFEIVERLREGDQYVSVTPKMVGRVSQHGYRSITRLLVRAAMVPPPKEQAQMGQGNRVTDADLRGYGEIATYLGVSTETVKRWVRENGLPVRRFTINGRVSTVEASTDELRAWRDERTRL